MEEEEGKEQGFLMTMFDFYWFQHQILLNSKNKKKDKEVSPIPILTPPSSSGIKTVEPVEDPPTLRFPPLRRSLGDGAATSSDSVLVLAPRSHLQTILSGKESTTEAGEVAEIQNRKGRGDGRRTRERSVGDRKGGGGGGSRSRSRRSKKSRSLSELEFEELKGFMDLGFTFSEAEADDPELVSIVPGLQRLGKKKEEKEVTAAEEEKTVEEQSISRPYLSEAWAAEEFENRKERLRSWRLPAVGEGVDMKDHIRFWAHTVASAVR